MRPLHATQDRQTRACNLNLKFNQQGAYLSQIQSMTHSANATYKKTAQKWQTLRLLVEDNLCKGLPHSACLAHSKQKEEMQVSCQNHIQTRGGQTFKVKVGKQQTHTREA